LLPTPETALLLNPETALPLNPETALPLNPETALLLNPGNRIATQPGNRITTQPGNRIATHPGNRIITQTGKRIATHPGNRIPAQPGNRIITQLTATAKRGYDQVPAALFDRQTLGLARFEEGAGRQCNGLSASPDDLEAESQQLATQRHCDNRLIWCQTSGTLHRAIGQQTRQ
jgi:hypothetical protein